uniref:ELM1/GtrOC1 family putative glycosyltransferase n=1 Tax=Pseudomaricurvus sp. TaxID=2004510 RepID=UPI003F6D2035
SASMLAEALNSRAHLTVLPLPSKRHKNKLLWAAENLQKQGLVQLYDGDSQSFAARQNQAVISLDEHFRCARLLLNNLYGSEDAGTTAKTSRVTETVSA